MSALFKKFRRAKVVISSNPITITNFTGMPIEAGRQSESAW